MEAAGGAKASTPVTAMENIHKAVVERIELIMVDIWSVLPTTRKVGVVVDCS
jgi:hypothetical protein